MEADKIKIERATMDDISAIQDLNKLLFSYEIEEGFDNNLDLNWSLSEEGRREIEERIGFEEISCGFIAKYNNQPVGYLIGIILEEETGRSESKYAELEHMFVDKNYRSKGIGEQLVEEFKTWTKSKGLKKMKANVSFGNERAINFYKKMGLAPSDVTMVMDIG